jgi:peptide/nickel transport system substrate-binding protein
VRKESVVTRAHRVSSRVALLLAAWVAGCGESDEPTAASPVSASRSAPLHDAATVAHLEATYGKNLLETDPIGNAPPANAKDTDVFLRWYGDSPKLLNANVRGDGNLADALLSYCLLDFAQRHVQDPSKFAPGVADYAAVSPDQRSLVVHLMPGIRWQFPAVDRADPKYRWLVDLYASAPPELTADDVVFTVTTILTPGVGGGGQRSIFDGVTVEALDRYTYRITWPQPNIYALQHGVSFQHLVPRFLYGADEHGKEFAPDELAAGFMAHWYNDKILGYGPYEFVSWERNVEFVLRRMDDFPVVRPAMREIRWQILSDAEQAVLRLKGGQLDFTNLMPQQYHRYVEEAAEGSDFRGGRFTTKPYSPLRYFYIGWNERRPPLDDARVRRALSMAANREEMLKTCFFGLGRLVESHVYPDHPFCNRALAPTRFDLEGAAKSLAQAGFTDADADGVLERTVDGVVTPLRIELIVLAESPELRALATVYQADLKKIGVELTLAPMTFAEWQTRVSEKRTFDGYTGIWSQGWELDFEPVWHSKNSGPNQGNHVGYANPEVDRLASEFKSTLDVDARKAMALRIQELIAQDQPYTFLFAPRSMTAYRTGLENVVIRTARPQLFSLPWHMAN